MGPVHVDLVDVIAVAILVEFAAFAALSAGSDESASLRDFSLPP
jgi:hypothetical protein